MTHQLLCPSMVGEAHVATVTFGHPSTCCTLEHGCISTTILEEDDLLALIQCVPYGIMQYSREGPVHALLAIFLLEVHDLDSG
jgi:hypothetical protein